MINRMAVSFALMAAIGLPACASATTLFRVKQNGNVFLDCVGVDYTSVASVKARLQELKRWNPHDLTVEFFVEDGAPAALVNQYRKLVVHEGFKFGTTSGPCN